MGRIVTATVRYSVYRCPRCVYFVRDYEARVNRCKAGVAGRVARGAVLVDDGRMKDNQCQNWRREK